MGDPDVGQRDRAAHDVGDVAGPPQPGHARGPGQVRGLQVPVHPGREPEQPRRRGTPEVVVGGRKVDRPPGVPDSAGYVARAQGQGGPVRLDRRRQPGGIPARRAPAAIPAGGASSRRSASRSRSSTPSISPVVSNAPAKITLSTGLIRTSSSGSASSQRRSAASCLVLRIAGTASSTRSAARSKSSAASAWPDGHGPLVLALVPGARPPVQVPHLVGPLVEQARLQHVGEEVVVAIPLAAVVERDEEQVRPVQRLQRGLAAVLPGDGIAQRTAQPVEDRGLQQEGLDVVPADAAAPPRPGSRRRSGRRPRSRR